MPPETFEVEPEPVVLQELSHGRDSFRTLVDDATGYFEMDGADDLSVARAFIERGYSEALSYWLVREVNVRRASGQPYLG
jgi:hypothetical protein